MKKEVYDIVNAGPRRRFMVRSKSTKRKWPLIVSNCENVTQALSRDVFGWQLETLYNEGIESLFTVHDETIIQCKDENLERVKARVREVMCTAPTWMPELPLGCDCKSYKKYVKG